MPVANTVEATLRSRYIDGISDGLQRTLQSLRSMVSAAGSWFTQLGGAVAGGMERLAGAVVSSAATVVTSLGAMAVGVAGFLFYAAKASSETVELKLIFESLAKSVGVNAAEALNRLRSATRGLVADQVLLKNANRVLQSDIPITTAQYEKLVANVYQLAKASGADGAKAVTALTDALVRGNASGLQSIGVNVNVKDAINQVAAAQGIASSKVDADTRLRLFYNELLAKTSQAVKDNAAEYISFDEAIKRTQATLNRWTVAIGEVIGRSGVFQELLKRYVSFLDDAEPKQDRVTAAALRFNVVLIQILKGIDFLLVVAALVVPLFNTIWQVGKAVFVGIMTVIGLTGTAVVTLVAAIFHIAEALAKLAGIDWFASTARQFDSLSDVIGRATISMAGDAANAVGNIFSLDKSRAIAGYSNQVHALVMDLEKFKGVLVEGTAKTHDQAAAQAVAADNTKKLAQELKAYLALMVELGNKLSTPNQQNLNALLADFRKIDEFRHLSEGQIREARLRALTVYRQAEEKLANERRERESERLNEADRLQEAITASQASGAKLQLAEIVQMMRVASGEVKRESEALFNAVIDNARKKRQEEQQKAISEAVSTANAIARAIEEGRKGKLSVDVVAEARQQAPDARAAIQKQIDAIGKNPTLNQVDDLVKLREAIEQLNRINMTPFQNAMASLKAAAMDVAGQAAQSFSAFFSDLVTGQEGAGKKLLAAFAGMVGQMLIKTGVLLVQMGIAEIAMASTLAGRLAGASVGAGVRAIAVGALLGAAGGVLVGASSNLAQTNQAAGSSGSFQPAIARPISGSTQQIINVGAPGRGQTVGEGQQQGEVHTVRIEVPQGFVTQAVERDIRGNGKLRTVIAQYAPA